MHFTAVQGFYLGFAYETINIPAIPRPSGGGGGAWLQMTGALLTSPHLVLQLGEQP